MKVAPFGGVKQSGIGREGSKYGMDEYLEVSGLKDTPFIILARVIKLLMLIAVRTCLLSRFTESNITSKTKHHIITQKCE